MFNLCSKWIKSYKIGNNLSVEKIPVVMWPLGAPEAIFLTGKLIDRQVFTRNLLNPSYFFQFLLLIFLYMLHFSV